MKAKQQTAELPDWQLEEGTTPGTLHESVILAYPRGPEGLKVKASTASQQHARY